MDKMWYNADRLIIDEEKKIGGDQMKVYNSSDGSTGKKSLYKDNRIKLTINGIRFETGGMGYEGLSQYLCSELLAFTNIESYARYEMTEMELNDERFNGCMSKDFLNEGEEIITADKLFKTYLGMSVQEFLESKDSLEERIVSFVNEVERITGIKDYGKELTRVLEWDAFVLNDDRHFNNIAFIYNSDSKEFSPCDFFDNSGAFLSNRKGCHLLAKNIHELMADVKAEVNVCEALYGVQLMVHPNICISKEVEQKIRKQYGDKIADRVGMIFECQKSTKL